jgi:hypothetical protein
MFISEDERIELVAWAEANKSVFKPNGYGRQYGVFGLLGYPPSALLIRQRIIEQFCLGNPKQEPVFQDYCGYITDGGSIHEHIDPNQDGLIHTRFNVFVSKPIAGGEPIQNGDVLDVKEGGVWRCDAGLVKHWCSPVIGSKPRIVYSFGFLL